ncbi:MAG: S1C family serine protease [Planctomycetota bacterium]|jgi:serine protease Do
MPRFVLIVFCCGAALAGDDLQTRVFRARDRALPALVNVQPVLDVFQGGRRRRSTATGSGVIVREDGLVVTNFHVAGHARRLYCTLADKTRVPAKLLGGDPATDLAVLQLDLDEVRRLDGTFGVAKLGAEEPPQVGEFVIALGSPRGLTMSLTKGVVSNTERYFGGNITLPTGELTGMYNNWIQTDAAINPGNSGGPLVNLNGEVVGINSRAIPGGDGLAFAIPAPVVRHVYEQIVARGRVVRAWIGLDRGLEPLGYEAEIRGVRIGHVDPKSPAAKAKIRPGDVILSVRGAKVDALHADHIPPVRRLIAESEVGRPLQLRLWRAGKERAVELVPEELRARKAEQFAARRFGLTVRAITEQYARRNGLPSTDGVLVTGVAGGGPAAASGLRTGDILLKLGRQAVADLEGFKAIYEKTKQEANVLVSLRRGKAHMFRALNPTRSESEEDEE